jgi:DNA-binding CsgD family transcriptional regulator/ArsR family metal-binding transcriptional regulator
MSKSRLVSAYFDFSLKMPSPLRGRGIPAEGVMVADFRLDADVSELAPYINAVAQKAVYYEKPPFIKFLLDGFACTLYQRGGSAAAFSDRSQALEFMEKLIAFLNDIYLRKDSIEPSHKRYKPVSVLDIFRLLPRTNCRECGFATCMAFAAALSRRRTSPRRCPGFSRPMAFNAVYPVFDGKGNLTSTVSIDIDGEAAGSCSETRLDCFDGQAKKLLDMSRPDGTVAATGNDFLPAPLTAREQAVLRLMVQGATNMEISDHLRISPHTVKSHVVHIFNKLGVNDRTQAAVLAIRHNFV